MDRVVDNKIILYIEDNPANLALMEHIIEDYSGVEMISAINAKTGLELAIQSQPDLLILDINLPDKSGNDLLTDLRERTETKDIPAIALSADAMPEAVENGLNNGFAHYLTKPINIPQLFSVLDEMLFSDLYDGGTVAKAVGNGT